jgi:hypothetical protein
VPNILPALAAEAFAHDDVLISRRINPRRWRLAADLAVALLDIPHHLGGLMSKKSFDARAAIGSPRSWLALGFAVVALAAAGCGSSSSSTTSSSTSTPPAESKSAPAESKSESSSSGIPQGEHAGDGDGDNHGESSDGDGNL